MCVCVCVRALQYLIPILLTGEISIFTPRIEKCVNIYALKYFINTVYAPVK